MIPIISAILARRINREKSDRLRHDEERLQASDEARAYVNREDREEKAD